MPRAQVASFAFVHRSLSTEDLRSTATTWCAETLRAKETQVFLAAGSGRFENEQGAEIPPELSRVLAQAEREHQPVALPSAESGPRWRVVSPLVADGEMCGALLTRVVRKPGRSALNLLRSFSAHLAYAARNARLFSRAELLSFKDDLTSLYNSRFLSVYLDRELKRARRAQAPTSLLFMDLDGFKQINDQHGHLAGSATLVEVATLLSELVRDSDVLVRYGGDEFVAVFPETPLAGGEISAERIRAAIANKVFLEAQGICGHVSASIGVAEYPACARDARDLIRKADEAMYQAKALGKNRVVLAANTELPSTRVPSTRVPSTPLDGA